MLLPTTGATCYLTFLPAAVTPRVSRMYCTTRVLSVVIVSLPIQAPHSQVNQQLTPLPFFGCGGYTAAFRACLAGAADDQLPLRQAALRSDAPAVMSTITGFRRLVRQQPPSHCHRSQPDGADDLPTPTAAGSVSRWLTAPQAPS